MTEEMTPAPVTSTEVLEPETSTENLLDFLANQKIFFKSQQINEPDLTKIDKKSIVEDVLNRSHEKFLLRFGKFLQENHLEFFNSIQHPNDDIESINLIINNLRKNLKKKISNIRNRRYTAMNSMIKNSSYFSEKEMMSREPLLYEELIGQYLTDTEKRARDNFDIKTEKFSSILLENIDKKRIEEMCKKQENDELSDSSSENSFESCSTSNRLTNELFPEIPASYKKQWGNFEDENDFCKKKKPQKFITGSEKEILRQEFVGIMYTKFLDGNDKDFDYTLIDDDTQLDDLKQISQDDEDKYFEEEEDNNPKFSKCIDEEMEDDLDLYMKHLNRNLSKFEK